MSNKCLGCGVLLQSSDELALGYTPKQDAEFCQRCFKLSNYGKLTIDAKNSIDASTVLKQLEKIKGVIVWVVDIFDFQASMKLPINRYLKDRTIIMALTKRDLLPVSLSNEKLSTFVLSELKKNSIVVDQAVVLANYGHDGKENLIRVLSNYSEDIILMGSANSGKSTLLKALIDQKITTSRYPGTTLDISSYQSEIGIIYDSPGLTNVGSVMQYIDNQHLETIIPQKLSKIRHFQIYEDQSFAIGGLVKLDILCSSNTTISFYISERLKVHRGKYSSSDELWDKHYDQLLEPVIDEYQNFKTMVFDSPEDKIDICIDGLGFICISKKVKQLRVRCNKNIAVTMRKAMI